MKGIALTNQGIEDIAAKEIARLTKAKTKSADMVVEFSAKDFEELCKVCYNAQSISRVLYLVKKFKVENNLVLTTKNIDTALAKASFSKWLNKENTFKVVCKRIGKHNFTGQDAAASIGEVIINKIKKQKGYEQKTDMKNPDVIVYVFIKEDQGYLGIDFAGFDLSKRDYKIFSYAPSLKASVAYAMLQLADFKPNKTLLDPFCKEGVVGIEGALIASKKPNNYYRKNKLMFTKYNLDYEKMFKKFDKQIKKPKIKIYCFSDQMRFVNAAKKNSKIAGVNKLLSFGRVEVEWLDARLSEKEIDCIVSSAPRLSRHVGKGLAKKLFNELFYQAKYILKPKGKIVLLSNDTEIMKAVSEKNEFKVAEERTIWQGKQELKICVFIKV